MTLDAIDRAMVAGACRALAKRAATQRKLAADYTTESEHQGHRLTIAAPEATVALGTARLLDDCAADLAAMVGASESRPRETGAKP